MALTMRIKRTLAGVEARRTFSHSAVHTVKVRIRISCEFVASPHSLDTRWVRPSVAYPKIKR